MKYLRIMTWLYIGMMVAGVSFVIITALIGRADLGYGFVIGSIAMIWLNQKSHELHMKIRNESK